MEDEEEKQQFRGSRHWKILLLPNGIFRNEAGWVRERPSTMATQPASPIKLHPRSRISMWRRWEKLVPSAWHISSSTKVFEHLNSFSAVKEPRAAKKSPRPAVKGASSPSISPLGKFSDTSGDVRAEIRRKTGAKSVKPKSSIELSSIFKDWKWISSPKLGTRKRKQSGSKQQLEISRICREGK